MGLALLKVRFIGIRKTAFFSFKSRKKMLSKYNVKNNYFSFEKKDFKKKLAFCFL